MVQIEDNKDLILNRMYLTYSPSRFTQTLVCFGYYKEVNKPLQTHGGVPIIDVIVGIIVTDYKLKLISGCQWMPLGYYLIFLLTRDEELAILAELL